MTDVQRRGALGGISRLLPGTSRRRWAARTAGVGAAMVVPALLIFTVIRIVPTVLAGFFSFTDWKGFGQWDFVGVDNYARLFSDSQGMRALLVTGVIAAIGTVVINALAVTLALLLNREGRVYRIYRTAIFYPYVISAIIAGFLFNAILNPDGAVNAILRAVGLEPAPFLLEPAWAVASIIIVIAWSEVGFAMLLYLAGLQSIPMELTESAEMDGASPWQRFRHITWPMLNFIITVNLVLTMSGLIRTYDIVISLTNAGPAGQTQTIAYRIISLGLQSSQVGYASAGAVVLLVITTVLSFAIVLYRRGKEVDA